MPEKRNLKRVRQLLLFISFFYITICLPFFAVVYFPQWHQLNCGWNIRCHLLGDEASSAGIRELNAFFWHKGKLEHPQWTEKEKRHLRDVRKLTDRVLIGAVFSAVMVGFFFDRKQITIYAWVNIAIILSFIAVLPFFTYFWRHVFHPLLFENKLWLNTSNDFSYYLMPRVYFKATTAFIIGTSSIINVMVWIIVRIGYGKRGTA